MIAAICFAASAVLWGCAVVRFKQAHGKRSQCDWQFKLHAINQACWFGVGGFCWGLLGCV